MAEPATTTAGQMARTIYRRVWAASGVVGQPAQDQLLHLTGMLLGPPPSQLPAAQVVELLQVGSCVTVAPGYEKMLNAADGPLKRGVFGEVVAMNEDKKCIQM